jgi:hypothetical protein
MNFFWASGGEALTLQASSLNDWEGEVDDQTVGDREIGNRLSPTSMSGKAGVAMRAPRAASIVELEINLGTAFLAANLVDDITVEIV